MIEKYSLKAKTFSWPFSFRHPQSMFFLASSFIPMQNKREKCSPIHLTFLFVYSRWEGKSFCVDWQQAFPKFNLLSISSWVQFWVAIPRYPSFIIFLSNLLAIFMLWFNLKTVTTCCWEKAGFIWTTWPCHPEGCSLHLRVYHSPTIRMTNSPIFPGTALSEPMFLDPPGFHIFK